jgi:cold shock protein
MIGKIKKIMDKGFGFIEAEELEKDIFFHATTLAEGMDFNSLREGDEVEFDVEETDKGLNAINVKSV